MKNRTQDLYARIETAKNLPVLPHILLKLLDTCTDNHSTIKDIARIINQDSSLYTRILRLVNSPYYRTGQKVADIEQALLAIGMASVKNIAITSSVYPAFTVVKSDATFDLKRYWWHSLLTAVLAKSIAEKLSYHSPEEAFLAGLLHDVGKLVLWANFPDEYSRVLQSAKGSPELLLTGEMQMGASHSEIAAWLLTRWNLPSFISDAVLYHHESFERIIDSLPLVKIVYTANVIPAGLKLSDDAWLGRTNRILGVDQSTIRGLARKAEEEARQLAAALDIHIGTDEEEIQRFPREREKEQEERLVREIREISLLQGTLQNLMEASSEEDILDTLQQGIRLLFDVRSVYFFLYDPENEALAGKTRPSEGPGEYSHEFTVPLQKEESILIKCLQRNTPLDSFVYSVKTMIIDEQIVHLLGSDGIVCLPLICRGEYVGVIVLGATETEVRHLFKRMKLLTMFTNQAALALHLDRTRRRQEKIVQSERMSAFSDMARKVNHEVNNPLGIIKNYLQILGMKLSKEDPVQGELAIINEEIDRVSLIISELAHFEEPPARETERVELNALLSSLVGLTKKSLGPGNRVRLHLKLDSSVPEIVTDKNSLKQAVINLIKNAIEAMPEGGNVFIETHYRANTQTELSDAGPSVVPGEKQAEITVRDDGPGIPDSLKRRLYEPHASTKGKGHFGLGLSLVYSSVMGLGGTIHCESNGEKGTTFRILLPVDAVPEPRKESSG